MFGMWNRSRVKPPDNDPANSGLPGDPIIEGPPWPGGILPCSL